MFIECQLPVIRQRAIAMLSSDLILYSTTIWPRQPQSGNQLQSSLWICTLQAINIECSPLAMKIDRQNSADRQHIDVIKNVGILLVSKK